MYTVTDFQTSEEAHLFRSYLESNELPAYVLDEYLPQIYWPYTHAIGGVRVVVDEDDAVEADSLFKDYKVATHQSTTSYAHGARAWPVALFFSIFLGMPALLFGRNKTHTPVEAGESEASPP